MVDKNLTTEMFEFNALSQFSITLFIYHDGQPCDLCQGQSIQGQGIAKLPSKMLTTMALYSWVNLPAVLT